MGTSPNLIEGVCSQPIEIWQKDTVFATKDPVYVK